MTSHGDTLAAMFVSAARDYPDRRFLRWCRGDDRITWSYAEAAVRVEALAARLDALGLAAGDHVVVHTAEMVPSIVFDLACACTGVVFTPLETTSLPAVLELCARTAARAVLTTPDRRGPYDELPIIAEDGRAPIVGDPAVAIARLSDRAARLDRDAIYMLQPTSGTTGGSKLVMRHHAPFVRVGRVLGFGLERASEPASRLLMVAAMTHGMGQYLLAVAMSLAAELCVTTRIDVAADIHEIRWLDPTYCGLTPRVLRSFAQQLGGVRPGDPMFGPSARFLMNGGAAPDPDLMAAAERSGMTVINTYGASEYSIAVVTRPGHWRPDLIGHALDDVILRLTDDGELEVKTPVMMRGYHAADELTRAAFTDDGFYRTGERATLGPDREFRFHGRMVDSFNLFDGSHVAPGPIEDAIARLAWVDQVVLLGDQRPYLTGLVVPHAGLRSDAAGRAPALQRLVERDLGRICSALDPNARVRRVAVLDHALPDAVHQVVGHGKVRRGRAAAVERFAGTIDALYGGSAAAGALVIDVPGAAAERRASSRQRVAWLVRVGAGGEPIVAYTRCVSRSGAFIEYDGAHDGAHDGAVTPGRPLTVEVIAPEGQGFALDAELVRREPSGCAIRWTGPAAALTQLARKLSP